MRFSKKLKQVWGYLVKTVKLAPKASQDLEDIWFYGYQHFGEVQADKYINHISDIWYFPDTEWKQYRHSKAWTGWIYQCLTFRTTYHLFSADWYRNYYYPYIKSASGCRPSSQLAVDSNHIALRENWQGYRGVPGQNSRSASSFFLAPFPFGPILFVLALPHFSQKR